MTTPHAPWTVEEDKTIRELYERIATLLPHRRPYAVMKRAAKIRVVAGRRINYSDLKSLLAATTPTKIGCLEWIRGLNGSGYGVCTIGKRKKLVHRVAFSLANPQVAISRLNVNHKCDNRRCINPDHLYAGTQEENMRDMALRGRQGYTGSQGDMHPMAKLTESKVRRIKARLACGETSLAIAKDYPEITSSLIRRIRRGAAWAHLK